MTATRIANEIFERNIICFDCDAKVGCFTPKLLLIADDVMARNRIGVVSDVYIPPGVEYDDYLFNGRALFGEVHVHTGKTFNRAKGIEKEYFKLGGRLVEDDKHLVIFYSRSTGEHMGGSV
jgi:hypothetical protein